MSASSPIVAAWRSKFAAPSRTWRRTISSSVSPVDVTVRLQAWGRLLGLANPDQTRSW